MFYPKKIKTLKRNSNWQADYREMSEGVRH